MLDITENRHTLRGEILRRYLPLVLLALLASTFLVAGRAFAGESGGSQSKPGDKVSNPAGQPGQTKKDSPVVCAANYQIVQTENASPVAGTDLVTGSQCDDCMFNVALPFSYSLYGQSYSSVTATS